MVNVLTKERNSKSSRWAGSAGRCGVFNKSRGFGAKLPRRILKAAGLPVRRPGGWGRSQAKPTVEVSTNFEGGLGPVDRWTAVRSPVAVLRRSTICGIPSRSCDFAFGANRALTLVRSCRCWPRISSMSY